MLKKVMFSCVWSIHVTHCENLTRGAGCKKKLSFVGPKSRALGNTSFSTRQFLTRAQLLLNCKANPKHSYIGLV